MYARAMLDTALAAREERKKKGIGRRNLILGGAAVVGFAAGRIKLAGSAPGPVFPAPTVEGPGIINDASEFSPTTVNRHIVVTAAPDTAVLDGYRREIAAAKSEGRPLVASAARHSMGGHSVARDGTVLTLDQDWIEPDTSAMTYRIAAGARWANVISRLDRIGFSPAVMQSNRDFGVASTFSVNSHGWPVPFSGCGSTVRSIKLLNADGELLRCSRKENADVFRNAMGGYGLFGVITELELDMVPNALLEPSFERVAGRDLGQRFLETLATDPTVQMAYGRMDVSLDRFFEEGLLISYRPAKDQSVIPPAAGSGLISRAAGEIFRAQLDSDAYKHLRWWMERGLGPRIAGQATRNSLMNEPVATLDDGDFSRADILHEYFVSPSRFAEFVDACRDVIPSSYQQLLNITLRYVSTDSESVLAYAAEPRIAAVMLFSQEKTLRAELDMKRMTEALIERVIAIGGSYYLPYRPHARVDQFTRAYSKAGEFAAFKRRADPGLLFRNGFWDNYVSKV